MTIWEYLSRIQQNLPLFLITPTFVTAVVLFFVGFCKRGVRFFTFGFGDLPKIPLDVATKDDIGRIEARLGADIERIEARLGADIGRLEAKLDADIGRLEARLETDIGRLEAKIEADIINLKVNDFAHLTNFLLRLCAILQDQGIISNDQSESLKQTLKN
jgi:hypothetical protein